MDAVLAVVLVALIGNATVLVVLWRTEKFLRKTLVYIKSRDVFQAEAVTPAEEMNEEFGEETPEQHTDKLEEALLNKQRDAYNNL